MRAPDRCPYCGEDLHRPLTRLAFDPWRGRLWAVCGSCRRWTPFPLEARWEVLEACERAVHDRGRIRLESENLSLVRLEGRPAVEDLVEDVREVVRVGRPPRVEMAGWRYGDRIPRPRPGFWQRLLGGLPEPPPGGYDPYGLAALQDGGIPAPWIASPFMEHAARLTRAFAHVPLARRCPSCGRPLLLAPWSFQEVRWVRHGGTVAVAAVCALCATEVALPAPEVRAALRLGLALVTPEPRLRAAAEPAARGVDEAGGPEGLVTSLADHEVPLGDLDVRERTGLILALDEQAELEALEAEWRRAEEITAIMDRELTHVPGFEAFRRRVLEESAG